MLRRCYDVLLVILLQILLGTSNAQFIVSRLSIVVQDKEKYSRLSIVVQDKEKYSCNVFYETFGSYYLTILQVYPSLVNF